MTTTTEPTVMSASHTIQVGARVEFPPITIAPSYRGSRRIHLTTLYATAEVKDTGELGPFRWSSASGVYLKANGEPGQAKANLQYMRRTDLPDDLAEFVQAALEAEAIKISVED